MLARIFARPCNVLIMDEPTNDLDLETLDLLEEMLQTFPGTVMVISHDRRFIDQFATETWVFDGDGHIETVVGGWQDVEAYYARTGRSATVAVSGKGYIPPMTKEQQQAAAKAAQDAKSAASTQASAQQNKVKSNKLSFTEAHELELLPQKIEEQEAILAAIDEQIADPALYSQGPDAIKEVNQKRSDEQAKLDELYERFELLLSKSEEQ